MRAQLFLLMLLFSLQSISLLALTPDEILSDPALESRARILGKDLRCLVCQNQSIDDSDAELARDLRILIRTRLKSGDSDEQVKQYIVNRYGDYVLMTPPFKLSTWVLWLSPILFLLGGLAIAIKFYRR
jgi:cytochrome c-type biogenesis protein CcmH